jgi:clathrin heavy chain
MDYELKMPLVSLYFSHASFNPTFCSDSYIKAADPSNFIEVIELANRAGKQDDLVRFLQMARKTLREPKIDTELAYAYAKTDRLHDMEDFLAMTNVADILVVGEKCFEDELYQAAKLLFSSISNWARLATTLIYLGENQAAVESARKAGNTQQVFILYFSYIGLIRLKGLETSPCRLRREG